MGPLSIYRIHKWFAVTAGVFLLVWLITGVVILLPPLSPGPEPVEHPSTVDFRQIELSPAQTIAILERHLGGPLSVNFVGLKRIQDLVAYEVRSKDRGVHLVNAASGQIFTITPEIAAKYVMQTYTTEGRALKVETVTEYSYDYQGGPLPVYRVVLDADPSVDFFVSVNDGTVRRSDGVNRLRGLLERFHTFDPIKLIVKSEGLRHGIMILAGIIGIAAAATGYYLAVRTR